MLQLRSDIRSFNAIMPVPIDWGAVAAGRYAWCMHRLFDEMASTWDDDPQRVERADLVAEAIRHAIPWSQPPRTVELGAGTGLLSRALADLLGDTVLLDSSTQMAATAQLALKASGLEHWRALTVDLEADPIPAGPFDLAISLLALHHIHDVPALLSRVWQVLTPAGRIAFADLDRDEHGWYHAQHSGFDGHHGFNRAEFESWLVGLGFTDVAFTTAATLHKDGREFPLFLVTAQKPAS